MHWVHTQSLNSDVASSAGDVMRSFREDEFQFGNEWRAR